MPQKATRNVLQFMISNDLGPGSIIILLIECGGFPGWSGPTVKPFTLWIVHENDKAKGMKVLQHLFCIFGWQ